MFGKKTLTCYNGIIGDGCGECPACQLRKSRIRYVPTGTRRSEQLMDNFFWISHRREFAKNGQGYSA